jgi:hypothetical protein
MTRQELAEAMPLPLAHPVIPSGWQLVPKAVVRGVSCVVGVVDDSGHPRFNIHYKAGAGDWSGWQRRKIAGVDMWTMSAFEDPQALGLSSTSPSTASTTG